MPEPVWFCPLCETEGADPGVIFCPVDGGRVRPLVERGAEWVGRIIHEKYRIVRHLGAGGMADVFEVERIDTGKRLALKLLKANISGDPQLSERFRQEARLISLIGHRNMVDIEDFGTTADGLNFMVMELLRGSTLAQLLRTGGVPLDLSLKLILQACEGMAAAHERGVIHRDLKTDNIFMQEPRAGEEPVVKILDLGIGKLFTGAAIRPGLTLAGAIFGTPAYMPPEQCAGEPVGVPADIYSLGVVFYELLFGRVPFDDDSHLKVFLRHATEAPPWNDAEAAELGLPAATKGVVLKALAKSPQQRHQSMLELQSDVAGLLTKVRHGPRQELEAALDARQAVQSVATNRPRRSLAPEMRAPVTRIEPAGIGRIPLEGSSGADDEVVELTQDVYWVGRRCGVPLECNAFLRRFVGEGGETEVSVLVDPGPPRDMEAVVAKVASIIGSIGRLSYIFLNHQDPDVCGSAPAIQQLSGGAFVICSEDTWRLARHTGLDPKRYLAVDSLPGSRLVFATGHTLAFVPTPFCPTRGAVMAYDPQAAVLFSGDLCAGAGADAGLRAGEATFRGVQLFHEIYMPSTRAMARALRAIRGLAPSVRIVAPQHGAIHIGEQVGKLLEQLGRLRVGMDLVEANEHDPQALRLANTVLREHRRVVGAQQARELLARFGADSHLSGILELHEAGEVTAFRVDPALAIDLLLGEILRSAPPELGNELLAVLTPLHGRVFARRRC